MIFAARAAVILEPHVGVFMGQEKNLSLIHLSEHDSSRGLDKGLGLPPPLFSRTSRERYLGKFRVSLEYGILPRDQLFLLSHMMLISLIGKEDDDDASRGAVVSFWPITRFLSYP